MDIDHKQADLYLIWYQIERYCLLLIKCIISQR